MVYVAECSVVSIVYIYKVLTKSNTNVYDKTLFATLGKYNYNAFDTFQTWKSVGAFVLKIRISPTLLMH